MDTGETKELTVLVWDQGYYSYIAEHLAPHFKTLYYFSEFRAPFPQSRFALVGTGLGGVVRVRNPWPVLPDVDLVVFPDVGFSPEQEYIRAYMGKPVFGPGPAEVLELSRTELMRTMKKIGLAVPEHEVIVGIPALEKYLLKNPDSYVKINEFRGDLETIHSDSLIVSLPQLEDFAHRIGPRQYNIEFIVEPPIPGCEIGYDGSCIDGQFSPNAMWGIERKDSSYIGQHVSYDDLPVPVKDINDHIAPLLEELGMRGFYSNEIRLTKSGDYYLTDPCMRAGSPPSEAYLYAVNNWPEHIWRGARGEVIPFEPNCKYFAEIMLHSDFLEEHPFLAVDFPEELREQVKLRGHCIMDGVDYVVNLGSGGFFGAAVGRGDSVEEAMQQAQEAADQVKAVDIQYDKSALQTIQGELDGLGDYGVEW